MKKLYYDVAKWSIKTFPGSEPITHLLKLREEVNEAIASPETISEYADCLIALFSASNKAGIMYTELLMKTCMKLEENKKRHWRKQPDGTYQHVCKHKLKPPSEDQIREYTLLHQDKFSLVDFADWITKTLNNG